MMKNIPLDDFNRPILDVPISLQEVAQIGRLSADHLKRLVERGE